MLKFLNVDYVFDSWRSLTSIQTESGSALERKAEIKIYQNDISNLISLPKKAAIVLDYLDNHYIISSIKYL